MCIRDSRFTGMASFLRTQVQPDLSKVDIGMIGVPYDGGVTNRPGARYGPREVRTQSTNLIRPYDQGSGVSPHGQQQRLHDIGDAVVETPFNIEAAHNCIEQHFQHIVDNNVVPISIGGDHSVTLPIFRALARDGPIGMVHFDAHCDTGDDYAGSKFHHGSPFKVAVDEGLLDPTRTIQIGIRGSVGDPDIWKFSHESGMRVIYMEELYEMIRLGGVQSVIDECYRVCGVDAPTYISFDVDALDPAYTPGTGTPEVGGMNVLEAQLIVRGLHRMNLIGADMVEVAPPYDPTGGTAFVGAQLVFEFACLIQKSMQARVGIGNQGKQGVYDNNAQKRQPE
eukprot:TRINITY_DN4760_c0_g1_i3.p1 TRINITY_DN4760_c0_g1~~TRINITY_DN4760_c0_g1_i3.p1  ORF type:complete len:338 (+),score=87.13 TRINITY_DN4760_c0_g1_i3:74-1087(+)